MWEKGGREEVLIICESVKVIIPLCYWRGENTSLDVQFAGLRSNKSLWCKRVTCMGAIQLHQIPLKGYSSLNRIEWNSLFTHCKIYTL